MLVKGEVSSWHSVGGGWRRGPGARHDNTRSPHPRPLPNLGQRREETCLAATEATHSDPGHFHLIISSGISGTES